MDVFVYFLRTVLRTELDFGWLLVLGLYKKDYYNGFLFDYTAFAISEKVENNGLSFSLYWLLEVKGISFISII